MTWVKKKTSFFYEVVQDAYGDEENRFCPQVASNLEGDESAIFNSSHKGCTPGTAYMGLYISPGSGLRKHLLLDCEPPLLEMVLLQCLFGPIKCQGLYSPIRVKKATYFGPIKCQGLYSPIRVKKATYFGPIKCQESNI